MRTITTADGNTVVLTDADGKAVGRVAYEPYGKEIWKEGYVNTPFLSGGSYGIVADTNGLKFFRVRYYNPEVERWTTVDPAKDERNWYEYCQSNPLKYIDPNGLWGKDLHDSNSGDEYEDTYSIAISIGFSKKEAKIIGYWDYEVDNFFSGTSVVTDLSWHFDTDMCPNTDSRLVHAEQCLQQAELFIKEGNKSKALSFVGKGLHAIQDISAHGAFNPLERTEGLRHIGPFVLHPHWYDDPSCDFKPNGKIQPGTGMPLESVHRPYSSRYSQFVRDTRAYLARVYIELFIIICNV